MSNSSEGNILVHNWSESLLVAKVKERKDMDPSLVELKKLVVGKKIDVSCQWGDGVLCYRGRSCVPNFHGQREMILSKAHNF